MSLDTIYSNSIISGIAQYLVRNNLLLLGCQLLIFPMGHAAGPGSRMGPFLKSQVVSQKNLKKTPKKPPKFKR